jgi:hypothetical protein
MSRLKVCISDDLLDLLGKPKIQRSVFCVLLDEWRCRLHAMPELTNHGGKRMYGLEQGTARRNALLTHATARIVLSALVVLASFAFAGAGPAAADTTAAQGVTAPPAAYVADFVATAATGIAMNDAGDVTGTSYPDPGCGPFCLPTLETVVWRGTERIVLPSIPGLTGIYVRGINAQGWVAGFAGVPGTTTHAVVWRPNGNTYQAIDLGTLPGTTISDAIGIDDQGRVVGWSTTQNFPHGRPLRTGLPG